MEKGRKDFKVPLKKGMKDTSYSLDLINPVGGIDTFDRGYKLEFILEDSGKSLGYYNSSDVFGNLLETDLRCNSEFYNLIRLADNDKEIKNKGIIISKAGDGVVKGFIDQVNIGAGFLGEEININVEDQSGNILTRHKYKPKTAPNQPYPFHMMLEDLAEEYIVSLSISNNEENKLYYSNGSLIHNKNKADRFTYSQITSEEVVIRSEDFGYEKQIEFVVRPDWTDILFGVGINVVIEREDGSIVDRFYGDLSLSTKNAIVNISLKESLDKMGTKYRIYYELPHDDETSYFLDKAYLTEGGLTTNKKDAKIYESKDLDGQEVQYTMLEKNRDEIVIDVKDNELKKIILEEINSDKDEIYLRDISKVNGLLDLSDSGVTSIVGLDQFKNIRTLDIRNTNIKDITPIYGITLLENIYLKNSKVSDFRPLTSWFNKVYYNTDIEIESYKEGPKLNYRRGYFKNNQWIEDSLGDKIILDLDLYNDNLAEGYYLYKSDRKFGEYKRIEKLYEDKSIVIDMPKETTYYKAAYLKEGEESNFSYYIEI